MKTAIIFYSYEGSSLVTADLIKEAINADSFRIRTVDKKKRKGFFKYLWGGRQVVFNIKPALKPLPVDINAYDLIILGTPLWAGSPAPALVSFLHNTKITGKKIALFCSYAGSSGEVFAKLKALLGGNTFAGEIGFKNPAQMESAELKQKISSWIKTLA